MRCWQQVRGHVLAKAANPWFALATNTLTAALDFLFMPKDGLDDIDRRIIRALQSDARLSNVELADRVGLSPSPCLRRVKRLEKAGIIAAYRAVLDRAKVGLGFSVFLGVKIDGHANDRALQFEDSVCAMPEVVACHLVSGEADYLLEVVVTDLQAYQRFLVGKLLELPIVREVKSNIAIQSRKLGAPLPLDHLG
jgi:Lrp/AsnC family leucine-responsive transcriptional regulator